jgi:HAD superfamily hydrolase (TIGR01509 family)
MEHRSGGPDGLGLIFDVDGVIVDSNPVHVETWSAYLKRCGREVPPGFAERMFGRRNDEIVRDLFGPALSREEAVKHGEAKEALYRETMREVFARYLVPGVTSFVMQQHGRPLAVASNAEPANVHFVLEAAGLRGCFPVVVDGHQVDRPKPDPQIYLRAADLLGLPPGDCIVFEDTPTGVEAACRAGMRVVGVATTYRCLAGVDLTIGDFREPELQAWLRIQRASAA